jgi:hypothetical protein
VHIERPTPNIWSTQRHKYVRGLAICEVQTLEALEHQSSLVKEVQALASIPHRPEFMNSRMSLTVSKEGVQPSAGEGRKPRAWQGMNELLGGETLAPGSDHSWARRDSGHGTEHCRLEESEPRFSPAVNDSEFRGAVVNL